MNPDQLQDGRFQRRDSSCEALNVRGFHAFLPGRHLLASLPIRSQALAVIKRGFQGIAVCWLSPNRKPLFHGCDDLRKRPLFSGAIRGNHVRAEA